MRVTHDRSSACSLIQDDQYTPLMTHRFILSLLTSLMCIALCGQVTLALSNRVVVYTYTSFPHRAACGTRSDVGIRVSTQYRARCFTCLRINASHKCYSGMKHSPFSTFSNLFFH